MKKKKLEKEVVDLVISPEVEESKPSFELNLDLGRQDLNDNFRKIQDAINDLKKG